MTKQSPQSEHWYRSMVDRVFAIDVRSLALFRMALGLIVLGDALLRLRTVRDFYSADAVFPMERARDFYSSGPLWSLSFLNGDVWFQTMLLLLTAVFAVLLFLGLGTRFVSIACWVMVLSIQYRLPWACTCADDLLRILLFWGMFLPLGEHWSMDARRRTRKPRPRVVSIASGAILFQVAMMYFFAGLHKGNDPYWMEGSALACSFESHHTALPLGRWFGQFPTLLTMLTHASRWLELIAPLFLFTPWLTSKIRMVLVGIFVGFHLGIMATIEIHLFCYVSMACWILFLPSEFWAWKRMPKQLREIAANRETTPKPTPILRRLTHGVASLVCLGLLVCVLLHNTAPFLGSQSRLCPPTVTDAMRVTGLRQHWSMFCSPPLADVWFAVEAQLADGRVVDPLQNGQSFTVEKPAHKRIVFKHYRWEKIYMKCSVVGNPQHWEDLAHFHKRRWNASHSESEQIVTLRLHQLVEFQTRHNPQKEIIGRVAAIIEPPTPQDDADAWLRRLRAKADGQ